MSRRSRDAAAIWQEIQRAASPRPLGEILERADRDMYARKAAKKAHAAVDMRHSAQAV